MKTSELGIAAITDFEQYHDGDLSHIGLQPKMCPAGVWTVGLGHALINKNTGKFLKGPSDKKLIARQYPEFLNMSKKQADELLKSDIKIYESKVKNGLLVEVKQHEFDALVCYVFNVGWSQTMFRLINSRAPMEQIISWWENHYITCNGKIMPGLIKRRKTEAYLFKTGKLKFQ